MVEIKEVKDRLETHARDDTAGFGQINGILKDHGERLAKVETNDARDAEDREREFLETRASSPQIALTPLHRKSWLPSALEKTWAKVVALGIAAALGALLRHCAPEVVPQPQPQPATHHGDAAQ